jgi:uncharacterized protein
MAREDAKTRIKNKLFMSSCFRVKIFARNIVMKWRLIYWVLILVITFSGCSERNTPDATVSSLKDPVLQERLAKDASFRAKSDSPIPEGLRANFQGLSYYPINPSLRFQTSLYRYSSPESIRMTTNTGEIRSGLLYGYFEFQAGGQICKLQVYRLEDASGSGPSLFIPFQDATSGKETYGAGRYLDFVENTSGVYDLDFNRAYNPYCAYNNEYSCPLPPAENMLSVPIPAGEKLFHRGH